MRDIRATLDAYLRNARAPTDSQNSWHHCYRHFARSPRNRDYDALHLAFFLASWGMYRKSAFISKHDYTIHKGAIAALRKPKFTVLWDQCFDFGACKTQASVSGTIRDAAEAVRSAYGACVPNEEATDTLVSKVLLGVLGCLPACDRFFIAGWRDQRLSYSKLNKAFIDRLFTFCDQNRLAFQREQVRLERQSGVRYPLMKLVDMYFHQIGRRQLAR